MKIGDIVKPTIESRYILASGCGRYPDAIVISIQPFILVSRETDMKWQATIKQEYFEVVGTADAKMLKACNRRLKD